MTVVLFSQNFVVFNHSLLLFFAEIWFIFTLTAWIVPQGFGASVHVLMGERKENVFFFMFCFRFLFLEQTFFKKSKQSVAALLFSLPRGHGNVERTSRAQTVIREAVERIEVDEGGLMSLSCPDPNG